MRDGKHDTILTELGGKSYFSTEENSNILSSFSCSDFDLQRNVSIEHSENKKLAIAQTRLDLEYSSSAFNKRVSRKSARPL